MAVTDYSQQRWGDPDVAVQVRHEDGWWPGFIDARRQRDHRWEALVIFTVQRDGYPHTRRGWFAYDELKPVRDASITSGPPREGDDDSSG